jgi:Dimethlysulfonioproprionate lyase
VTAVPRLIEEIDRYLQRFDSRHIAEVRGGIAKWRGGAEQQVIPRQLPVCSHLDLALAAMDEPALAAALRAVVPLLRWVTYDVYPRADIGAKFADGHAFASLIGEDAPMPAEDFDLGLFVIAPRTLYRDHLHAAPELYAPLSGPHGWRFKPGDPFEWRPAHVPVWNEPYVPHATLVGETPFLCVFCWTSDVNAVARVIPAPDWGDYET